MSALDLFLLHDGNGKVRGVEAVLAQVAPVRRVNVRADAPASAGPAPATAAGALVCVNHSTLKFLDIQARLNDLPVSEAVFVLPSFSAEYVSALKKLGVAKYLVAPAAPEALIRAVSEMRNRVVERRWQKLAPMSRDALVTSLTSFRRTFDDVRAGGHVDIPEVQNASALVAKSASTDSLTNWLDAIKDHHDYTYRHCMSVCGSIVHFGHNIGIRADELELLSLGGMLHDIGKARIPLSILDKPGKLDAAEREKMGEHPAISRLIMESMEGLDPRIIDMAVHHHEKLDGTGYPDGLAGDQIDDLARLTAIADVFSALIDERAYKPAMSYEESFARMERMKDHLDQQLLARFKEFAMDTRPKAA